MRINKNTNVNMLVIIFCIVTMIVITCTAFPRTAIGAEELRTDIEGLKDYPAVSTTPFEEPTPFEGTTNSDYYMTYDNPNPVELDGMIYIPDVNIYVPFVFCDIDSAQYYVDCNNCAAMFYYGTYVIGDHYNQNNFCNIAYCIPGETIAWVDGNPYICESVIHGHNTGYDITDGNYNSLLSGNPIMYTCENGWQNIVVVKWAAVDPTTLLAETGDSDTPVGTAIVPICDGELSRELHKIPITD